MRLGTHIYLQHPHDLYTILLFYIDSTGTLTTLAPTLAFQTHNAVFVGDCCLERRGGGMEGEPGVTWPRNYIRALFHSPT